MRGLFSKKGAMDFIQQMTVSAQKALDYFSRRLDQNGSFGAGISDLSCYYKAPMMFIVGDRSDLAAIIIRSLKHSNMQSDGDFLTCSSNKSIKPEYTEFWTYTNGWIARAAYRLKIKDVSEPAFNYICQYQVGQTNKKELDNGVTDILTAAHHGLVSLEHGEFDRAIEAGNYLCECVDKQPSILKQFYLRFDQEGNPITEFPSGQAVFYNVCKKQSNQLYFMIAYPAAYLGLLHQETQDEKFLKYAKLYLDYGLSCDPSVLNCRFSHKLAWAASILYKITQDPLYLSAVKEIVSYFIQLQDKDGLWFQDEGAETAYDQSAEVACWLFEIANNFSSRPKSKLEDAPGIGMSSGR